jgi:predicted acyl esterase
VDITSSNFPRRARNTNSGNAVLANDTAADIRIATNVVYHSEERPSFIALSLLPISQKERQSQ